MSTLLWNESALCPGTGVQVRPQVLIRVRVDREAGSVTFSSETATLGAVLISINTYF